MHDLVREAAILISKPKKKKTTTRRKRPRKARGKSKAHLIEPFAHLFGERSDDEIAEMAGVSSSTVAIYRARAGIAGPPRAPSGADAAPAGAGSEPASAPKADQVPSNAGEAPSKAANAPSKAGEVSSKRTPASSKGSKRAKGGRKKRPSKIDPYAAMVGQVADRVVAEKAGVTVGAVRAYRRARRIPAARSRATRAAATAATKPSAKRASGSAAVGKGDVAWRVALAGRDAVVVLAPTLTDAAARAAGLGEVRSLERVGPVV